MKYLCKLAVSVVLISFSLYASAVETLRVAVVFDTGTTSISSSERFKIAKKQVEFLNQTMEKSDLNNDIQFQLVTYKALAFSSTFEDYDDIQNKYLNVVNDNFETGQPSLPLNFVSRDYNADIVIAVFDPWGDNGISGRALMVPNESMGESAANLLSFADSGIVFIHENHVSDYTIAPHEVGHTFGLYHGYGVSQYTGDSGHYDPLNAFDTKANGYGKSSGSRYGTIMTGYYLNIGKPTNSFSNPNKYDCGSSSNVCGDSFSDATSVIKRFKTYYNNRGNFYN